MLVTGAAVCRAARRRVAVLAGCGCAAGGGIDPVLFAAALDTEAEGFAPVDPGWDFAFPRDQGPHPDYRTEVWDLSGQVVDDDGLRYGLRLTFVRIGLVPPAKTRASTLAANAVLLARFAFIPEDGDAAKTSQRASRAAVGLAGADVAPWRVWLEDWSLEQGADDEL
jgi:predicted secreted hydrolase